MLSWYVGRSGEDEEMDADMFALLKGKDLLDTKRLRDGLDILFGANRSRRTQKLFAHLQSKSESNLQIEAIRLRMPIGAIWLIGPIVFTLGWMSGPSPGGIAAVGYYVCVAFVIIADVLALSLDYLRNTVHQILEKEGAFREGNKQLLPLMVFWEALSGGARHFFFLNSGPVVENAARYDGCLRILFIAGWIAFMAVIFAIIPMVLAKI
jgi:hypothetical protein